MGEWLCEEILAGQLSKQTKQRTPSLSVPFACLPNALEAPVTHRSLPCPVRHHACATAAILSLHPTLS